METLVGPACLLPSFQLKQLCFYQVDAGVVSGMGFDTWILPSVAFLPMSMAPGLSCHCRFLPLVSPAMPGHSLESTPRAGIAFEEIWVSLAILQKGDLREAGWGAYTDLGVRATDAAWKGGL